MSTLDPDGTVRALTPDSRVPVDVIVHPGRYSRWEAERRFVCTAIPAWFEELSVWEVVDRYVDGTRLRIRRMTERTTGETRYKLGQKLETLPGNLAQLEVTNIYVGEVEYDLLRTLPGRDLHKVRHVGTADGLHVGIDVFAERELMLLTVDFESIAAMESWQPPADLGPEVTNDLAYSGGHLAGSDTGGRT